MNLEESTVRQQRYRIDPGRQPFAVMVDLGNASTRTAQSVEQDAVRKHLEWLL